MTMEIRKEDWSGYFDRLNRDMADQQTTVRIISEADGVQILSEGLPFAGLTADHKNAIDSIELTIGNCSQNHQLHNIFDPIRVAFQPDGAHGGTLDIVDASGASTLITFGGRRPALMRKETEAISTR